MARCILVIAKSKSAVCGLRAVLPDVSERLLTVYHGSEGDDKSLFWRLRGFEGDILIDRDVRLTKHLIDVIRWRLSRGKGKWKLAYLPRLHIKQALPEFVGGMFDQVRWQGAQRAVAAMKPPRVDLERLAEQGVPSGKGLRAPYRLVRQPHSRVDQELSNDLAELDERIDPPCFDAWSLRFFRGDFSVWPVGDDGKRARP